MKYTIESRHDGLVVIRSTSGLSIVTSSLFKAHRFDSLERAKSAFSALRFKYPKLHSGFKIHEVQS